MVSGTITRYTGLTASVTKAVKRDKYLIFMVLPGIVMTILFKYLPIYGILMAFERFNPAKGILGSEWVGLYYFKSFFTDMHLGLVFKNTVLLGIYSLLWYFPMPIILAIVLNEVNLNWYKRAIQTITYLPHFISVVIVIGIMRNMLLPDDGIINIIIHKIGLEQINFFGEPQWFRTLYIGSSIWQGLGFSSIIYLAAITNINTELYEAATIDGANRLGRIRYVTIPGIMPIIVITLILAIGGILGNDFTKILLIYNPLTYETADVIGTYTYRVGIEGGNYSYSTAVGLLLNIISFILVLFSNNISRKINETSLW